MTDQIEFRIAKPSDAKAIAELHTQSWQKHYSSDLKADYLLNIAPEERQAEWAKRLNAPSANQYVAVVMNRDKLAAFICLYLDEDSEWGSYINNLHVNSEYQGNGLGKALLLQALEYCSKKSNSQSVYLLVNRSNKNAQDFYLKHGAKNIKASVWNAPDGSAVPTYWFAWTTLSKLKLNDS
jgi:ribosomal protein S18 acetylase RimI-like enzyme